jgi:hypothetical protein
MIAELLRYPSGTASATERPDRRSYGLPYPSDAGCVTTLQSRREEGVGAKATGAEIIHNRPHHVSPIRSYRPHLRLSSGEGCIHIRQAHSVTG